MPPEQPGIGRLTSTPQGVDMADGGSPHGGATRKPPQPMAPDTAVSGDSCRRNSRWRHEAASASGGMKPSRLGAPPHPLRPAGHLPQIPRSSAEFGGGGISLRDAYPSPFTLHPSGTSRVLRGYDVAIGEGGARGGASAPHSADTADDGMKPSRLGRAGAG